MSGPVAVAPPPVPSLPVADVEPAAGHVMSRGVEQLAYDHRPDTQFQQSFESRHYLSAHASKLQLMINIAIPPNVGIELLA